MLQGDGRISRSTCAPSANLLPGCCLHVRATVIYGAAPQLLACAPSLTEPYTFSTACRGAERVIDDPRDTSPQAWLREKLKASEKELLNERDCVGDLIPGSTAAVCRITMVATPPCQVRRSINAPVECASRAMLASIVWAVPWAMRLMRRVLDMASRRAILCECASAQDRFGGLLLTSRSVLIGCHTDCRGELRRVVKGWWTYQAMAINVKDDFVCSAAHNVDCVYTTNVVNVFVTVSTRHPIDSLTRGLTCCKEVGTRDDHL